MLSCIQPQTLALAVHSVDVNFGWNQLPFCDNNKCIVSGYLNEWTADMPTVFVCMAEAYGELIYTDDFRGGNELSAELTLPNVSGALMWAYSILHISVKSLTLRVGHLLTRHQLSMLRIVL